MSSIMKYEPFRDIEQFARRFNDLFHDGHVSPLPTIWAGDMKTFIPKVDISEDDKSILLHAELPGMEKSDVKVTLSDDRVLSIKGEKKHEEKKESKNYLRVERSFGSFERTFALPENIQKDGIIAAFDKGVLNITLPKTEIKKPEEKEIALN